MSETYENRLENALYSLHVELVDARVVIGELETERNSLRALVKSYEDADTGPVGRVEAEETPMTQGKKTLKDKMWRHALDVAPPSASHSRIITSACDFLADKVEELINQKGGDADARAKPGMDSPEHDANRPDVTPPPVGAARGEAPVCASCRQAMKHDGGPDYSCDERGTKHTLGPRKAGGEEYRPRLPPLALREVCKEWEDSLPRPSEWSSDMVRFLCNQYAGLGFRPRNRTWQSVETEAAARLGRMDAEAGRERMENGALFEAIVGSKEAANPANGYRVRVLSFKDAYDAGYSDAIPWRLNPSKEFHEAFIAPRVLAWESRTMGTETGFRARMDGFPVPWQRVGG